MQLDAMIEQLPTTHINPCGSILAKATTNLDCNNLWCQHLWHLRNWIFSYHLTVHCAICGISTKTYSNTMACTQSVLVSTTHITIELSNTQAQHITIKCSITVNFYKWCDNHHWCACLLLRSCFDVMTCLWARYFVMKCTQHTCNMQLPRVTSTQHAVSNMLCNTDLGSWLRPCMRSRNGIRSCGSIAWQRQWTWWCDMWRWCLLCDAFVGLARSRTSCTFCSQRPSCTRQR